MMLPRMHVIAVLMLATVGSGFAAAMESPAAPEGTSLNFTVRMHSPVAEPFASSTYFLPARAPARPAGGPDPAAKARLDRYYSILSGKLRAVPGLSLITGEAPGAPEAPYQVAIRLGADWRGVSIEATSSSSRKVLWRSNDTHEGALSPRLTALWDDVPADIPDQEVKARDRDPVVREAAGQALDQTL
jgi:hypothetical protein